MTPTDYYTVQAMLQHGGSFAKKLAVAAQAADPENLSRIKTAFPELWTKYSNLEAQMSSTPEAGE